MGWTSAPAAVHTPRVNPYPRGHARQYESATLHCERGHQGVGPSRFSYPTRVFCSGVSRAGISRPDTLRVGAAGRSAAVCCVRGGVFREVHYTLSLYIHVGVFGLTLFGHFSDVGLRVNPMRSKGCKKKHSNTIAHHNVGKPPAAAPHESVAHSN